MEEANNELKELTKRRDKYIRLGNIQVVILIVIIMIYIGIFLCFIINNKTSDNCDYDDGLSKVQIMKYNAEFANYEGEQSGANVRTLIEIVNSHNTQYADEVDSQIRINNSYDETATDEEHLTIEPIGDTSVSDELCTMFQTNNIKSAKKYNVHLNYINANSNYRICNIDIKEIN